MNTKGDEEDPQFIADITTIGKNMLNTIKQMATDQDRPLWEFTEAAIQALFIVHGILIEDEPFMVSLREKTQE